MHNEKELQAIEKITRKGYKFLGWHDFKKTINERLVKVELHNGYRIKRKLCTLLKEDEQKMKSLLNLKSGFLIFNLNKYLKEVNSPYKILSGEIKEARDKIEVEYTNNFKENVRYIVTYETFSKYGYRVLRLENKQAKILTKCEGDKISHRESNGEYNYYVDNGDYMEIITFDMKGRATARVKIDKEDFDKVRGYSWHIVDENMYARSYKGSARQYLHRLIMGCPKEMCVDHINGDVLDNRKNNLRVCTIQENNFNKRKLNKNNLSGLRGVSWSKQYQKWAVQITINGKRVKREHFSDLEEAKKRRVQLEKEYYGEFAPIHENTK